MAAPNHKFLNRFIARFTLVVFCLALLGSPEVVYPGSSKILVKNYPGGGVHFKIETDEHRQPHGGSREYSEIGTLKSERHYQHGVRDGIGRLYYMTGELMTNGSTVTACATAPASAISKTAASRTRESTRTTGSKARCSCIIPAAPSRPG